MKRYEAIRSWREITVKNGAQEHIDSIVKARLYSDKIIVTWIGATGHADTAMFTIDMKFDLKTAKLRFEDLGYGFEPVLVCQ